MSIILIDGPEKAGKSTVIKEAMAFMDPKTTDYRHWSQPASYADYLRAAYLDLTSGKVVFWDRGWPSDTVYGRLLPASTRRFQADPWLGEWLLGRAVMTKGLRIVLAPTGLTLELRRAEDNDPTDHAISPYDESAHFAHYGHQFGYDVRQHLNPVFLAHTAVLANSLRADHRYTGPFEAKVVFVGLPPDPMSLFPIPFASPDATSYGRLLGDVALDCGWTTTEAEPEWLQGRPLVIACGDRASHWCRRIGVNALNVPSPSWLYRWAKGEPQIEETERSILLHVSQILGRYPTPAPAVPGALPGY